MNIFQKYAQYYDLLYSDKNYKQEAAYIDALIKKNTSSMHSILEFGCGTGKHARLLAGSGYMVHGVDVSPDMIVCARQQETHDNLTFSCADIRLVDVGKTFDAVISLFHVMSYQVTNDDLDAVFLRASKHLVAGGLFIFDAWYGPAVLTEKPCVRVKRVENEQIKVVRIAEPALHNEMNCVDVFFTIFFESKRTGVIETFNERHTMRYLFVPEIVQLCERNSFELVKSEEFLTKRPLDCSTWGASFVCRKQ